MGYWMWKDEKGTVITVSPECFIEDMIDDYPDAVPVRPRFVKRGDTVDMPAEFVKDYKLVMGYYGYSDLEQERDWKLYIRAYPEDAIEKFRDLANDIRQRPERGIASRIRNSSNGCCK